MLVSDVLTHKKRKPEQNIEDIYGYHLVVHNDDVNTFDWVIESLVSVCGHTPEQAEQCAYIIHFKGKYAVKDGEHEKLSPMREALIERGINATID